jgi:hypothetical protein
MFNLEGNQSYSNTDLVIIMTARPEPYQAVSGARLTVQQSPGLTARRGSLVCRSPWPSCVSQIACAVYCMHGGVHRLCHVCSARPVQPLHGGPVQLGAQGGCVEGKRGWEWLAAKQAPHSEAVHHLLSVLRLQIPNNAGQIMDLATQLSPATIDSDRHTALHEMIRKPYNAWSRPPPPSPTPLLCHRQPA